MKAGTGLTAVVAAAMLSTGVAQADKIDYKDYNELIVVSRLIVELHDACGSRLTEEDRQHYQSWRDENRISAIEHYIDTVLSKDRAFDKAYRIMRGRIKAKADDLTPQNCPAFSHFLKQKQYQPATAYKRQVRRIVKAVSGDSATPPKSKKKQAPLIDETQLRENLDRIETVIMDSKMRMGVGGALYQETNPILLLDDGWAATTMKALVYPGGFDKHRQDHPSSWKEWRSSWGDFELLKGEEWQETAFDTEYEPLPEDTVLHNTYERLTGAGNVAVGGGDSVIIINGFQFFDNGRFIKGKHVSATAENGLGSVVVGSTSPDERGSYEIKDYVLTLNYDNGHKEMRGIVFDPDDTEVIWLNGYSYIEPD